MAEKFQLDEKASSPNEGTQVLHDNSTLHIELDDLEEAQRMNGAPAYESFLTSNQSETNEGVETNKAKENFHISFNVRFRWKDINVMVIRSGNKFVFISNDESDEAKEVCAILSKFANKEKNNGINREDSYKISLKEKETGSINEIEVSEIIDSNGVIVGYNPIDNETGDNSSYSYAAKLNSEIKNIIQMAELCRNLYSRSIFYPNPSSDEEKEESFKDLVPEPIIEVIEPEIKTKENKFLSPDTENEGTKQEGETEQPKIISSDEAIRRLFEQMEELEKYYEREEKQDPRSSWVDITPKEEELTSEDKRKSEAFDNYIKKLEDRDFEKTKKLIRKEGSDGAHLQERNTPQGGMILKGFDQLSKELEDDLNNLNPKRYEHTQDEEEYYIPEEVEENELTIEDFIQEI